MIAISIIKGNHNHSITAKGHAGAEYGKDVVCAAVSALMQNMLVGLELLEIDWDYRMDDGELEIIFSNDPVEGVDKALFLLETTVESLREISSNYKDKVEIMEKNDEIF